MSQRLKGKSGAVPGAEALLGLIELNSLLKWSLVELDRAK